MQWETGPPVASAIVALDSGLAPRAPVLGKRVGGGKKAGLVPRAPVLGKCVGGGKKAGGERTKGNWAPSGMRHDAQRGAKREQIRKTQDEPQWIVAQRRLSARTIPGFS